MSKLREAAAMLVTEGKVLGSVEQAKVMLKQLELFYQLAQRHKEQGTDPVHVMHRANELLATMITEQRAALAGLERLALSAHDRAQELLAEVEHPGAALARRVVAASRAARAAWRAAR